MKKKLTYRDKLIELAQIYSVREVLEYIKNKKNLTTGQLELILRKNKIIIPKDFNTNFFKENFSKPLSKISKKIDNLKEESIKTANKVSRKISYFRADSFKSFFSFLNNIWKLIGNAGMAFLNVIPKLLKTYYDFFGKVFTDLFHGIYDQQINKGKKVGQIVVVFFVIIGLTTIFVSGFSTFKNLNESETNPVVKKETKKLKETVKKIDPNKKIKKEVKKIKPKIKSNEKKGKVSEVILPDLNLKTQTVLISKRSR